VCINLDINVVFFFQSSDFSKQFTVSMQKKQYNIFNEVNMV